MKRIFIVNGMDEKRMKRIYFFMTRFFKRKGFVLTLVYESPRVLILERFGDAQPI